MAYTRPAASAADATWLGAAPYTRPASTGADATFLQGLSGIVAAQVGIAAAAAVSHGASATVGAVVPVAASADLEYEASAFDLGIAATIAISPAAEVTHGMAGTAVAGVGVVAALSADHGTAGTCAAQITLAGHIDAEIERYEARGEVRLSGILVNRRVRVYSRSSGALVGEADTVAGRFAVHAGFTDAEVYVLPIDLDSGATDFTPPTSNRVVPVLAMDAA